MLFEILTVAADAEAKKNAFGFWEALEQGGAVAYATVIILAIMSFGSFFILFTKWFEQRKIMSQHKKMRGNFWRANSLKEGATKLEKDSAWRQIVDDGIVAEEQHAKMGDSLEAHDWLHGSLARSEDTINAKLASGLSFLATVGATAPFIGLFGTVVGIYRALINIGIAGSASIDKVAGPVGEALIMTALGLLVAVPAVLAYNYLQARNKRIAETLHGFSTDVLAYISSDGKVKPVVATAAPAKTTTTAAKPAPAKVGAPGTSTTTPPTKK
ncbi:MotA/TolQ/ExbB proton channel family protein [Pseudoblastomonas halimionae]|uniref:Biopolymer transport protein ExbB n=1 Tax=Alteriqipengyuania halimionae TaxID=1926630 RepID=A0A6I4U907_9SPHN|nr:MotA/TolQ/ExbB proton channel family protein [Alteriqipengyuania halimionae]MXP10982.1 MotA/TolQ/ExbB proton channel family protein [Alteriqipengyuania halimionae]